MRTAIDRSSARGVVTTSVLRRVVDTTIAGLLVMLLPGCVVMDNGNEHGVRGYQRAAERALTDEVMPKLLAALAAEDRQRLGSVTATATVSIDPLRVALERDGHKGSRLVVSTTFLSLQDALIDGSVIASATTGHEQQLVDYSIEVARYALGGARVDQQQQPEPFWQYIGWTAGRYETFSADPRFEALRQRATMQSLAWLAASLLSERLNGDVNVSDETSTSQRAATLIRQRTADLLLRARLAPVPAWSVAILFNAIRNPRENGSNQWICGARDVLEAALAATSTRDLRGDRELGIEWRETVMDRWRAASQILERGATCDASLNTPGSQGALLRLAT